MTNSELPQIERECPTPDAFNELFVNDDKVAPSVVESVVRSLKLSEDGTKASIDFRQVVTSLRHGANEVVTLRLNKHGVDDPYIRTLACRGADAADFDEIANRAIDLVVDKHNHALSDRIDVLRADQRSGSTLKSRGV